MKKWPMLVGALALMIAVQPAEAQIAFGPQVAYGDDTELGFGGRVEFDLTAPFGVTEGFFAGIFGIVSATFYPSPFGISDLNFLEISGNAAVPFPIDGNITPYAGAGVQWGRLSNGGSQTDIGLNLLGGIKFALGAMNAFAEANLSMGDFDQFSVKVGLLFGN